MIVAGSTVICGCGGSFTAQHDNQRSCSRACAARFRVAVGKQRGSRLAASNWRKNTEENRCPCSQCVAGRKAALTRLAAKGLGLRKFTPEEWKARMHGIAAARKQGDAYAWSGE